MFEKSWFKWSDVRCVHHSILLAEHMVVHLEEVVGVRQGTRVFLLAHLIMAATILMMMVMTMLSKQSSKLI